MNIAIHGRKFSPESIPFIQTLFDNLVKKGASLKVSKYFHSVITKSKISRPTYEVYQSKTDLSNVNFIISMGGDGTLLEAVTHIGDLEIPILGINLGRLGFLATTAKERINLAIDALYKDYYKIDKRSLIKLISDPNIFDDLNFGLNEMTILKKDTSSMIVVHAYIDGEYLNSYWADGLIVSTPTGSTGYSLSCGGPLVLPQSNNFIITPVSPHNLNVRPMIVSDKSVISFEIEGRSKNFLVSIDSRSYTVDASIKLAVKKEEFCTKLVKLDDYNFLDNLRQKLNWGLDVRN